MAEEDLGHRSNRMMSTSQKNFQKDKFKQWMDQVKDSLEMHRLAERTYATLHFRVAAFPSMCLSSLASLLSLLSATEFADTADHVLPLQLTCALLNALNFLVTGVATYWKWETKAEKNRYAANEYDALLSRLDMLKNSVEIQGTDFWSAFQEMEAKIGEVKKVCGPPDIWVERKFKRDKLLKDLNPLYQLQMERKRVLWGCLGRLCPSIVITCCPNFCTGLTTNRSAQKVARPTNGELLHGHGSKSCRELDVIDQKLDTMVRNVKANFFEPPTSMGILWQQIRLLFEETISTLDLPSSLSLMPLILPHLNEFRKFSPNADTPLHIAAKSRFQQFFEHVITKGREFQPGQMILADVDDCLPLDYFVLPDANTMSELAERDRVLIVRLFLTTLAEAALESINTWRDFSQEARESKNRQHVRRICLEKGLLRFALKNQLVANKWGNPDIIKLPAQRDAPEHESGLLIDEIVTHGWSTEPTLMHLVAFYGDTSILDEALRLVSKESKTKTSKDPLSNWDLSEDTDNENCNVLVYACQAVITFGELEPARKLMKYVIDQKGETRAADWLLEAESCDPMCHKKWWWPYQQLKKEFKVEDPAWQDWYGSDKGWHDNTLADGDEQEHSASSHKQETIATTGNGMTMAPSEKTLSTNADKEVDPDCMLLAISRPQPRGQTGRKRANGSGSVSCRGSPPSRGDLGRPEHQVDIPVNKLRMPVLHGSGARRDRLPAARPDETAEMPICPGCKRSMFWNERHGDAWHCENFAQCRNGQKNMGQGRWYCKSCQRDVCKACYPRHADEH